MSDFILEYEILESIAKNSKLLGKQADDYAESLNRKVLNAIESVTGDSSVYLTCASDSVRDKINALKQKSDAFYSFAEQITNLLEVAEQMDQEVANIIAGRKEYFITHHKSLRINDWKSKLQKLLLDMKNSIPLLKLIADILDGLVTIFESLKKSIKDGYKCAAGKYKNAATQSVAAVVASVTSSVTNFLAICTAIGAGIGLNNAVRSINKVNNGNSSLVSNIKKSYTGSNKGKKENTNTKSSPKSNPAKATDKNSKTTKDTKKGANTIPSAKNPDKQTKPSKPKDDVKVDTKVDTKDDVKGTGNPIIDNLMNDKSLKLSKSKKETMKYICSTLLKEGFEPAFIAGVLGNILAEGSYGHFESSAYISHPESEPDYLKYMDDHYNYRKEFSGKNITEVGIKKTKDLLDKMKDDNNKNRKGFGLGSVQWTFGRTYGLIDCYIAVCGEDNYPTSEQCLKAESMFIVKELTGKGYKKIYDNWLSKCSDKDNAAYNAGSMVCLQYEVPKDTNNQAKIRGNNSEKIYNIMMGKK